MVTFTQSDFENLIYDDHEFAIPKRHVFNPPDMKIWEHSEAYMEYMGFILALNKEAAGLINTGLYSRSGVLNGIVYALDQLSMWIDDIPPVEQPQRFGNKAFRLFYTKLNEEGTALLEKVTPIVFHTALKEIKYYFFEGFGNSIRIDYGTGHEMSFCMFLCCLFKIGALKQSDKKATVCYIFKRYLEVVRKLQTTYNMEPAGSRGVWALDDFQFVPFLWGSSQLTDHPVIETSRFYLEDLVNRYSDEYLFMGCIKFINSVKKGPFAEHSNQLWNISGVPTWEKVNAGLIRMYKGEVLGKFPVIQHVLFGTVLPFKKCTQPKTEKPLLAFKSPGMESKPKGMFSGSESTISTDPQSAESKSCSKNSNSSGNEDSPREPVADTVAPWAKKAP